MLALAGITIPGGAYSWTAVFVLPLNSATDPVIYTLVQFVQNFISNRRQERQMLLATAGSSVREGRTGPLFRLHSLNANNRFLRAMSKVSSELSSNHIQGMAESSISTSNNGFTTHHHSNLLLRSSSYAQANSLLMRPPAGYQTLGEFMRTAEEITTRDLLEICHSISANLKEFHDMGFALGTIGFDKIFVTKEPILVELSAVNEAPPSKEAEDKQINKENGNEEQNEQGKEAEKEVLGEYRLQTYIPGIGFAYRVPKDENVDDYAVNMEEFGLVVKRMLQHYHARQMQRQASSNSVSNNNQNIKNENDNESNKTTIVLESNPLPEDDSQKKNNETQSE